MSARGWGCGNRVHGQDGNRWWISWSNLWQAEPIQIKFLIQSVYNVLPRPSNLYCWGKVAAPTCPLCQRRGTLEQILSCCPEALGEGCYLWCHDQVLKVIAESISSNIYQINHLRPPRHRIIFVRAGQHPKTPNESPDRPPHMTGRQGWTRGNSSDSPRTSDQTSCWSPKHLSRWSYWSLQCPGRSGWRKPARGNWGNMWNWWKSAADGCGTHSACRVKWWVVALSENIYAPDWPVVLVYYTIVIHSHNTDMLTHPLR